MASTIVLPPNPRKFTFGDLVRVTEGLNGYPAIGKVEEIWGDSAAYTYFIRIEKLGKGYREDQLEKLTDEEAMVYTLER